MRGVGGDVSGCWIARVALRKLQHVPKIQHVRGSPSPVASSLRLYCIGNGELEVLLLLLLFLFIPIASSELGLDPSLNSMILNLL